MIGSTRSQQLMMAWDVKNWDQESTKVTQTQELMYVLDFHEFRIIHGRLKKKKSMFFLIYNFVSTKAC